MSPEPRDDVEARWRAVAEDHQRGQTSRWILPLLLAAIAFFIVGLVLNSVPLAAWAVVLGAFVALPIVARLPPPDFAIGGHIPPHERNNWATRLDKRVHRYMNLITIGGIAIGIILAVVAIILS